MNTVVKRILYISLILTVILGSFYLYLPPHPGCIQTMEHTVGRNRVDVAVIGSSHVFNAVNPIQMYRDYGVAAYDLAYGAQAPWQSYYYLIETDNREDLKLVLLDMYTYSKESLWYFDDANTVRNLLDYPFGINKWKAIEVSICNEPVDLLFAFPYTYSRYNEFGGLNPDKNVNAFDLSLGYDYQTDVCEYDPSEVLDASEITGSEAILPKCEEYLRKEIEYCQEHDIAVVLYNAPWPELTEALQKRYNYIGDIADEYGILFLDGNRCVSETGVDYSTDCFDDHGHLNHRGVTKFTNWIMENLEAGYDLPDRRGLYGYEIYDQASEWIEMN